MMADHYAMQHIPQSQSRNKKEQDVNVDPEDVVQPHPDDKSHAISVDSEQGSVMSHSNRGSSDEEDNIPLAQLDRKYRRERENSYDEDDYPLWELSKRLKSCDDQEVMPSPAPSEYDNNSGGSLVDINECRISNRKVRKSRKDKLDRVITLVFCLNCIINNFFLLSPLLVS